MGQTAVIKDPKGNVVTVRIRGREAQSFQVGQPVQIPDKASMPANWPWPQMPKSIDASGLDCLQGFTCEVTDDPPPSPPPPAAAVTREDRVSFMLREHGLTIDDLKTVIRAP